MPQIIRSIRERAFVKGLRFFFLYDVAALGAGQSIDLVACCAADCILESFSVTSDSPQLSWEPFAGTLITPGSGQDISPIARNARAATSSKMELSINPTILDVGQAVSSPIKVIGVTGAGNNDYIDTEIISQDFQFLEGLCYMIRLTNTDAAAHDFSIELDTRNNE
jgi:hypothetical protein